LGDSPRATTKKDGTKVPLSIDINNDIYNVLGLSRDAVDTRIKQYTEHEHKVLIDRVLGNLKDLNDATAELSKISNYWSDFVSNRVAFYDYKNYAPFKGRASFQKASDIDEVLEFDTARMGKELQEVPFSFEGRTSVSDNPVLQTMSDAIRAAMRAGRKDLTRSIKNSLAKTNLNPNGQGLIPGRVKKRIKFEDRDSDELKSLKGEKTIFHYNEDGTIDVLVIDDPRLLNAIRRTYKDINPLLDMFVNFTASATSLLGKMHTRYNVNFPPLNFVRDALTNAWTIGAELGPAEAARLISTISSRIVMNNMMPKAVEVMVLYEKGNFARLNELAKQDVAIRDMVELIQEGGLVTYLEGLSVKSNFDTLNKKIGRSGVIKTAEQFNGVLDIYVNMFELASRSAAYSVVKRNALAKGDSETTARARAAAYAKGLANFELVGEWGRTLSGLYMFFRPAATGAVRAIEAAAPAFDISSDGQVINKLPEAVKKDPAAVAKYMEEHRAQKKNARIMVASLMGGGAALLMLSQLGSDDDDMGRNQTLNDNMQQWTRYARFHIPRSLTGGKEVTLQMPWGFGLGAFAAAGAQLAAVGYGIQSMKEAMANIFLNISLDSFVPIPVSRMNPLETPLEFFMDSLMPSLIRPVLELVINKDGLGRDINSASGRRFGDSYISGENIPEIYKDAARYITNETLGQWSPTPNTLYFLANSYADGLAKLGEYAYGFADLKEDRKDFNPKTDIPLLGSFFGTRSNVDAREFAKLETKMAKIENRVKTFELDPEMNVRYKSAYPLNKMAVEYFNKQVNGRLRELRSESKKIKLNNNLDPRDRTYLLKINTFKQNLVKQRIMSFMEAYDIED
jgi:hypothetical protein